MRKLTLTMVSLVIAMTACKQEPRLPGCNSQEIQNKVVDYTNHLVRQITDTNIRLLSLTAIRELYNDQSIRVCVGSSKTNVGESKDDTAWTIEWIDRNKGEYAVELAESEKEINKYQKPSVSEAKTNLVDYTKFVGIEGSQLLNEPEVMKTLYKLLGGNSDAFDESMALIGVVQQEQDWIYVSGCAKGECTVTGSILAINLKTNEYQVAMLNEGSVKIYHISPVSNPVNMWINEQSSN